MAKSPRTTRLVQLAATIGLALGLAGLALPAASAASGMGWLRLAHLSPNTPAVDVYLYSFGNPSAKIVLQHVAYGDVSPYEHVPAGEYTVAMRAAGASAASKPVLSTTVNVVNGGAYTVAGMGPFKGIRLQIFQDQLRAPRKKALVRIIQASMQQDTVKVTAGSTVLSPKLAFTSVTSYRALPPGEHTVRATGSGARAASTFNFTPDTIYTLVVLDNASHLKVAMLEDSAGSKVVPNGAVSTGLGGTAARPGAALLPWTAAVGAGLLLAAAGGTRMRRRYAGLHAR